ncbi:hypothetical protein M758_1G007300 [Ceratodon purpureus]|nr:hypothetical protein M758_1G007300 [Ceratodon purpureus]
MPSHRRGETSGLGASVQLQSQSTYNWLSCTPQAHCRSEPLSYHGANLAPLVDVESWFPATTGFELTARNSSPPGLHNFQQPAEMPMGSSDDGVEINTGSVFPLSDYQSETWWPPINVQMNLQSTIHQNILSADRKPGAASDAVPFTGGSYNNMEFPSRIMEPATPRLEMWCPEATLPVAPATVDSASLELNTPNRDTLNRDPAPTSALAAVSTAVAEAAAAEAAVASITTPSPSPAPSSAPSPVPAPAGPSRVPRAPKAASRKGKSVSAPTSPSELRAGAKDTSLGIQKSKGGSASKRPLTQRQNHIWSERQRRKGMNYLFESLRSLLPHPSPTNKTDKSTVVGEIIKYIQTLQVQLELLTKKQQQMLAARTLISANQGNASPFQTLPRAFVSNGVTLVDHSSDPSSMTAITALPPPGRESCLQSYLGANVGLHVCGLNVFITTSSPRGRRGLFHELLVTIHKHALDVINANISTSNTSIFHCLHCQASQDAELLNNDLHHALQSVISQFG